jgi:hypothetical protein
MPGRRVKHLDVRTKTRTVNGRLATSQHAFPCGVYGDHLEVAESVRDVTCERCLASHRFYAASRQLSMAGEPALQLRDREESAMPRSPGIET